MVPRNSPGHTRAVLRSHLSWKTMHSLAESDTLTDIFKNTGDGVWQVLSVSESRILRAHFPEQAGNASCSLLPLTWGVALWALLNNQHNIDCRVDGPIFPGETLKLSRTWISIGVSQWEPLKAIEFEPWKAEAWSTWQGTIAPEGLPMTKYSDFTLPQWKDFQFVTHVNASEDSRYFSGVFDIQNDFDIALLPELVAQMGLAVGSATKKLKAEELYVYSGGKFNFATNIDLQNATSLHLSAEVIKDEKREVSYIFSLRTNNGEEIFWWQVDGKRMPYKILVRWLEGEKTKRRISE